MGCPAWLVVLQEEERSLHGGVGTQHHLDAGTQGCCAQEWTQAWGRAVTLGGMGTGRLSYNSDTVWPLEGKAVGLRDSLSPSSMGPAAPRRLLCGLRGGPWVPTLGPGHTALAPSLVPLCRARPGLREGRVRLPPPALGCFSWRFYQQETGTLRPPAPPISCTSW